MDCDSGCQCGLRAARVGADTTRTTVEEQPQNSDGSSAGSARLQPCGLHGFGSLPDLPRGDLHRLGKDPALEDHARYQGRPLSPGMRSLPRPRIGSRRRRRRHYKDFHFQGSLPPKKSTIAASTCHAGGAAAHECDQLDTHEERRELHLLPLAAPRADHEFLLSKPQPELCYGCHLQQKAQFEMPFHHRVNEGLMQCSDCHNVHGTVGPKQVRTSSTQDAVCFTVPHRQGRPIRLRACRRQGQRMPILPHASTAGPNAHMLKLSNVNLLCLQCHTTSSFSARPALLRSITRPASSRHARCATSPSTDPTSAPRSSSRDVMNTLRADRRSSQTAGRCPDDAEERYDRSPNGVLGSVLMVFAGSAALSRPCRGAQDSMRR